MKLFWILYGRLLQGYGYTGRGLKSLGGLGGEKVRRKYG